MAAVASLVLSACGFHLRGSAEPKAWPESLRRLQIKVTGGSADTLLRQLRSRLRDTYHVDLVENGSAPVLFVTSVKQERRVLSTGATAKASEYLLQLRVGFKVTDEQNQVLLNPQTVILQRDYRFDSTNVLATEIEERHLLEQMQTDAARRILNRVMAVTR